MVVLFMGFLTCLKSRTLATSAIVWNKTNFLLQPVGDSVVIFIKLHDISTNPSSPFHFHHFINIHSLPCQALMDFALFLQSIGERERQSSTNLEYPVWLTLWGKGTFSLSIFLAQLLLLYPTAYTLSK